MFTVIIKINTVASSSFEKSNFESHWTLYNWPLARYNIHNII